MGERLIHEAPIHSVQDAAFALNHVMYACEQGAKEQSAALQDYAVPALKWTLQRIQRLEALLDERKPRTRSQAVG